MLLCQHNLVFNLSHYISTSHNPTLSCAFFFHYPSVTMDNFAIDPALLAQSAAAKAQSTSDNINKCKADLINEVSSKKSN